MTQQGQVFKLKTKGADGQPLWAYRYRLEGRGSERPQVGGFATRAEAETALCKVLDRLGPGGGRATITLAEFVDEYLEMHQAEPVTIAKLRWLLSKATAVLGEKRLADLSPRDVYGWRFSVPEGHRFEATQALRQVLNRAVAWGLLDYNPANRGVPNPARRAQVKAGIEPVRGLYDLRHTSATFALRAGIPVFAVSRFMGSSIAMIDRHFGHLVLDSREQQSPSSTRSRSSGPWTLRGRRAS